MQRSEAQRQASRINGSKSRGPITPTGKNTSKFNGLKHGLRAEHVVLPGENPAEFEAERQAWLHDWNPKSHTRAILIERAAIASWRLRRSVKAEAAFLAERAETAAYAFDSDRFNRVERAIARADVDAVAAVSLLELDAHGLDRLIASCGELERALEGGPKGWDQPHYHMRLMLLIGQRIDEYPSFAGPIPKASARLLAANNAEFAEKPCFDYGHGAVVFPLPEEEYEAAVETIRRAIAEQVERLRERRGRVPEPAELRRRAVAAAYADGTEDGKLRHRYEMAIDRSLRATILQLMMLEKSGADLAGDKSYPKSAEEDTADESIPPEGDAVVASGSVGAGELGSTPTRAAGPIRGLKATIQVPEPGGGGGSRR